MFAAAQCSQDPRRRTGGSSDAASSVRCGGNIVVVSILSVAFPGILVYLVLWIVMPRPE